MHGNIETLPEIYEQENFSIWNELFVATENLLIFEKVQKCSDYDPCSRSKSLSCCLWNNSRSFVYSFGLQRLQNCRCWLWQRSKVGQSMLQLQLSLIPRLSILQKWRTGIFRYFYKFWNLKKSVELVTKTLKVNDWDGDGSDLNELIDYVQTMRAHKDEL